MAHPSGDTEPPASEASLLPRNLTWKLRRKWAKSRERTTRPSGVTETPMTEAGPLSRFPAERGSCQNVFWWSSELLLLDEICE